MTQSSYEIINGAILPDAVQGRPMEDDSHLIEVAIKGLKSNEYRSPYHAAVALWPYAKGASKEAIVKRLYRKIKAANTVRCKVCL
jgi:hypothetical protein